jgi:hypothetical protein
LKSEGGHSVTAEIDHDRLPADDTRTVAVRALSQVRVLVVDGEPQGGGREAETFYLRHALLPVPRPELEQHYNKVTIINYTELDAAKLDQYDAVFLCNVPDFTESTASAFADYLKKGGGFVIFPGGNVIPRSYNELLAKKWQFLPAELGEARGDAAKEEDFTLLQDKNFDHPIAAMWNDPASSGTLNVHFYRTFDLNPVGDEKAGPEVTKNAEGVEIGRPRTVLRFQVKGDPNSAGKPAMMERTWGAGRVVLFASTADTAWNDLGARPHAFIPLVHRTLGSIVSRQDEALNVRVGERLAWRGEQNMIGREALVTRPGYGAQDPAATEARRIALVGNTPLLTYDDTSFAGTYRVKIAADEPANLVFAAQSDPAESALEELDPQQVKELGTVADVQRWTAGMPLTDMIQKKRVGTELWKYLALAALILATTETILAHWFSKSK